MNPNPASLFISGPPAGGKTYRGRLLAESLGYKFIDVGSELEKLARSNPHVQRAMKSGDMVDDRYFISHLIDDIKQDPWTSRVFVGVRKFKQIECISDVLSSRTHRIFHVQLERPKEECEVFALNRGRGEDDTAEVFGTRWNKYEEYKEEVPSFFRSRFGAWRSLHYEMTDVPELDLAKLLSELSPLDLPILTQ